MKQYFKELRADYIFYILAKQLLNILKLTLFLSNKQFSDQQMVSLEIRVKLF